MATYLDTPTSPERVLTTADLALAHALQIDGRAPLRHIATVLGVSDQTVARHYSRLRGNGLLRVLGLTDPVRTGASLWFVRVRCTPDAAGAVGAALARRTDTTWVNLSAGGTEITCMVRHPGTAVRGEQLLLEKLPRTPRVVDVSAHGVLHVFFGQEHSSLTKTGPLTAEQIAALTPALPQAEPASGVLGPEDRVLADLLARDGRAPVPDLARATGLSPSTVRRRIAQLRASGALYFDVEFHPDVMAATFRAALWLEVEPARLQEAGTMLAGHPEVPFVAATSGTTNLYASVQVPDAAAFYTYLTHSVAAIPSLRHSATAPVHRTLKGPGPYLWNPG